MNIVIPLMNTNPDPQVFRTQSEYKSNHQHTQHWQKKASSVLSYYIQFLEAPLPRVWMGHIYTAKNVPTWYNSIAKKFCYSGEFSELNQQHWDSIRSVCTYLYQTCTNSMSWDSYYRTDTELQNWYRSDLQFNIRPIGKMFHCVSGYRSGSDSSTSGSKRTDFAAYLIKC